MSVTPTSQPRQLGSCPRLLALSSARALSEALGWGLSLALAIAAAPAAAQAHGLGLNWTRGEGAEACLSAAQLMARIETRAHRILFERARDAPLSLDGYVRRITHPAGWLVTLELSLPDGQVVGRRQIGPLDGDDCSVIEPALDLAIDLALDPDGTFGNGTPLSPEARALLSSLFTDDPDPPPPAPSPAAAPALKDPPALRWAPPPLRKPKLTRSDPAPVPTDRPAQPFSSPFAALFLDASGTAGVGELPGAGLGVAVHAALATRSGWSVELGFSAQPRAVKTASLQRGRVVFDLEKGSLAACLQTLWSSLAACAGGEYGRLGVAPSGFVHDGAASSQRALDAFVASVLRIGLAGPAYLRGALLFDVPLIRNDFLVETSTGSTRWYRSGPVQARAELGLGARF